MTFDAAGFESSAGVCAPATPAVRDVIRMAVIRACAIILTVKLWKSVIAFLAVMVNRDLGTYQPVQPLMIVSRRSNPNARSDTATIGGPCRRL